MPFELLSSGSKKNQDVVQIALQFGKGLKKLFSSSKNSQDSAKTETKTSVEKNENLLISSSEENFQNSAKVETQMPVAKKEIEDLPTGNHQLSFGMVYANDLAKAEIEKDNPNFPVGSIIVREKNLTATSESPQTVIAMVKREKGFSKETGDWEFFVFNGADLKMQKRETKGACAQCHIEAKQSDWVFRDYLK